MTDFEDVLMKGLDVLDNFGARVDRLATLEATRMLADRDAEIARLAALVKKQEAAIARMTAPFDLDKIGVSRRCPPSSTDPVPSGAPPGDAKIAVQPRDESVPAPGWREAPPGPSGNVYIDGIVSASAIEYIRNDRALGTKRTWEIHDAEHGYTVAEPPSSKLDDAIYDFHDYLPRERWMEIYAHFDEGYARGVKGARHVCGLIKEAQRLLKGFEMSEDEIRTDERRKLAAEALPWAAAAEVDVRADERKRVEKEIASTMIDHEQHLQETINSHGFVSVHDPLRVQIETIKTWRRKIATSDYSKTAAGVPR